MRRQFSVFMAALFLFLLIPQPSAGATDTPYGTITIENRNETENAFSCDVNLSGATIQGYVFAVLCAESGQVKQVAEYQAAQKVEVKLQNVAKTDSVKILWTDANHMPLADPIPLTMSENNAAAYDQFAKELAKLDSVDTVIGQDASENPYALARLLVSCDPLPDLSEYKGIKTIQGPNNFYVLQFNDQNTAKDCETYLNSCPTVRYVEPDVVTLTTDEKEQEKPVLQDAPPYLSWGVEKTGIGKYAEDIQKRRGSDSSVVVAVLDSGVDAEGHPSLQKRLMKGFDYVEWDDEPKDEHGHGTHVAGAVVDCTPGVNVKIMPVRVLNAFAGGSSLNIFNGIHYAIDHGANIINLSLSVNEKSHQAIEEAIYRALSKNITVVTAAGNSKGFAKKCYPANIKECITVAAVNEHLKRFERSNYGDAVDIAAPGEAVNGFLPGGKKGFMDGTSMATPHVSAAAALLMCDFGTGLTPGQISDSLKSKASEIPIDQEDDDWKYWKNFKETSFLGAGFLNMRPFIQSGLYAILYADGEMVFQKNNTPASGRNVLGTYPVAASGDSGGEYALWYAQRANIRKVTFAEPVKPLSTALWFYGCGNLSEVQGLNNLDTSEVTNMSQMFARCASLKALDLRGLDTRKVTNMGSMFFSCTNLAELDLTGWDTKNVTDTRDMFNGCTALKTLHASDSFSTAKISDSAGMFQNCNAILGGQNTAYDPAHTDKAYARMDGGASMPGYFKDRTKERPSLKDVAITYVASPAEGGTVSGVATAKAGEEVTVVATPAENYKVVKITAGNTEVTGGKFTVPTGVTSLTVTATFENLPNDNPTLTIGNAEATIGTDTMVSIPVSVQNLNKAAGLIIRVTYPQGLSVKEGAVVYQNAFESQVDNAKDGRNPLQIAWNAGSAKEVTYSGELATIYFDVSNTAKAGTYDITAEVVDAALNGGADITDNVVTVKGQVTLKYGDNTPSVSIGSAEATLGTDKTVSVPVSVQNFNKAAGLIIRVTYPQGLSVKEGAVVYQNVFESQLDNAKDGKNPLQIAWNAGSAKEVTYSGELCTINFDVTNSAKAGTYDIAVEVYDAALNGGRDVTNAFAVDNGQVTLKKHYDDNSVPTLTIGDATVTPGSTVTVPVSVRNLNNVAGLIIRVTYPKGLSVEGGSVVYQSVFESQVDNAKDGRNPLQIAWNAGSAKEVTYSGELCTINFNVSDSAKAGTYDITAEVYDAALNGGDDITDAFAVVNGTLTIGT